MKKFLFVFAACFACVTMSAEDFYSIDFTQGQDEWTINNVQTGGLTSEVWQQSSSYGMKGCAYVGGMRYATESWLISPAIDLAKAESASLVVNQAVNKGAPTNLLTKVSTNGGTSWTNLPIGMPAGSSWAFSDYQVSLDSYVGKSIQIAFVYVSTTSEAATWEIKKVTVSGDVKIDVDERDCRYMSLKGLNKQNLLNGLYDLINDHTVLTYDACRADKAQVDLDASGNVMDMYSDCELGKKDYCTGLDEHDDCECHNREHMLPKSFWGSSTEEPMYTDLHHVIPTDYVANTQRSAWIYDEVSSSTWTNGVSKLGTSKNFSGETAFEPADEYKGDVARVYFYMMTCYKDKSFTQGGKGWKYFNSGTATLNNTALALMLKWHRQDPVSKREKTRNDKVENKQGNRNPFVDDPGLVEYIWGTMTTQGYDCESEIRKPDSTTVDGAITCQEARDIALALASGKYDSKTSVVVGYVTSAQSFDQRNQYQTFWMADEKGTEQVFYIYKGTNSEAVEKGDKVAVTGTIYNYNGTPEIKSGKTKILVRASATATENIEVNEKTPKILKDGRLYIQVGDQLYDVLGRNVTE